MQYYITYCVNFDCLDAYSSQIYSFDGNFRLVRRKNAGKSVNEPFNKGDFFLEGTSTIQEDEEEVHEKVGANTIQVTHY